MVIKYGSCIFLIFILLIWREREEREEGQREGSKDEGGEHQFIAPRIYAFTGCLLYVGWNQSTGRAL